MKISKVRAFKLAGDVVSSSAAFDIQSNLKIMAIGENLGGYLRYKLKLRELDFW